MKKIAALFALGVTVIFNHDLCAASTSGSPARNQYHEEKRANINKVLALAPSLALIAAGAIEMVTAEDEQGRGRAFQQWGPPATLAVIAGHFSIFLSEVSNSISNNRSTTRPPIASSCPSLFTRAKNAKDGALRMMQRGSAYWGEMRQRFSVTSEEKKEREALRRTMGEEKILIAEKNALLAQLERIKNEMAKPVQERKSWLSKYAEDKVWADGEMQHLLMREAEMRHLRMQEKRNIYA